MRRDDFELPTAPANDRPSDHYQCGSLCSGEHQTANACALGPTSAGICRHEKVKCDPVTTVQLRCRRWKSLTFALGALVLIVGSYVWGQAFYKPGPLSTPHAQILSGQFATASCAACHPQAKLSSLEWFLSGHDESSASQSERCMDCHHATLPRDFARTAHNLSEPRLQQIRDHSQKLTNVSWNQWLPQPSFSNTDVACATCHREHAGADASLTILSDAQCQTCHANRFTSFAKDHPSWNAWPYTEDEPISFNHRSHGERHFPATRDEAGRATHFDCVACHAKTETGEFARTTDYATACGGCHDKTLNQQAGERLDLFVLPSLLKPNRNIVGDWPMAATGFYDGKVGPLARWLLRANREHQAVIQSLPGEGDYARINPEDSTHRQAAETLAVVIRDAMESMAKEGPIPGLTRGSKNSDIENQQIRKILQGLSPQLIGDATQRWFHSTHATVSNEEDQHAKKPRFRMATARGPVVSDDDDILIDTSAGTVGLLSDPLSDVDPVLESTNSEADTDRSVAPPARNQLAISLEHHPVTMQPEGGWYVDDTRMAITYRGHGHADPVLRAAIELAAGLPPESTIRRELLETGPAVACIQCHPGAATVGSVVWKPLQLTHHQDAVLTKFAHDPHMNLPNLADCKQCHSLDTDVGNADNASFMKSVSLSSLKSATGSPHDFGPMTKQLCASCHTNAAAGDSCIKCHLYHTEPTIGH